MAGDSHQPLGRKTQEERVMSLVPSKSWPGGQEGPAGVGVGTGGHMPSDPALTQGSDVLPKPPVGLLIQHQ